MNDTDKLNCLLDMNLTYNDYLIIGGDVAVRWNEKLDHLTERWYKRNVPCKVLFVDGNHENHDLLDTLPITEWNGGNIHIINEQINHLMRGQVFNIDGKTLLTMGGGYSVDKMYRTEGISWWSREMPSKEEYEIADINLKKHDYKVDYILTHDCPEIFLNEVITNSWKANPNELNMYLNEVYKAVTFKKWYFGHHHNDMFTNDFKCRCLYQDVIQIKGV